MTWAVGYFMERLLKYADGLNRTSKLLICWQSERKLIVASV